MKKISKNILLVVLWSAFSHTALAAESNLPFMEKQLFFRNNFSFNDGQSSQGATAFLISYKNKIYVVTAKHMLNEWMGIEPAILPSEFSEKLNRWLIQAPFAEEVLKIEDIVQPLDDWKTDIILLTTKAKPKNYQLLKVAKKSPKKGDVAYIIGCPYAEENCRQNAYPLIYLGKDGQQHKFLWLNKTISSRGFSGAPMVDKNGNVLAVYNYHHDSAGKDVYVGQSVYDELLRISNLNENK